MVVASETFSQRNQGMTIADAVASWHRLARRAGAAGLRTTLTVAAAFGCPFEGEVAPDFVADVACPLPAGAARRAGLRGHHRGGGAEPGRRAGRRRGRQCAGLPLRWHFHNTRNTGYANALAALGRGASALDASVGGIGGCPFAPAATGNIATEDLLYLLHRSGVRTGIDPECGCRRRCRSWRQRWGTRCPGSWAEPAGSRRHPDENVIPAWCFAGSVGGYVLPRRDSTARAGPDRPARSPASRNPVPPRSTPESRVHRRRNPASTLPGRRNCGCCPAEHVGSEQDLPRRTGRVDDQHPQRRTRVVAIDLVTRQSMQRREVLPDKHEVDRGGAVAGEGAAEQSALVR